MVRRGVGWDPGIGRFMKEYGKKVLKRLWKDIREFGIAGMLLAVYMTAADRLWGAFCSVRMNTGVPCPGCGITRAAILLLTGRWRQAWQMHPMIYPIMLAALYFVVSRYLLGRKAAGMKWIVAGIAVMLLAVYIQRMGQYFPNRSPYLYEDGNMLEKLIPEYRRIIYAISTS